MRKLITVSIAFVFSLCIMALCGCGSSDAGSSSSNADRAGDSAWKAAYLTVLQTDEDAIKSYTRSSEGTTAEGQVALPDVDGDGIPTLMYFVRDTEHPFPYLKIYTFVDGAAKQVSYEKPFVDQKYSDLPVDALYDYEVQGGTNYLVTTDNKGNIQMYSSLFGVEDCTGTLNSYTFDPSGIITMTEEFGYVDASINSIQDDSYNGELSFWNGSEQILSDDYESLCNDSKMKMDEVIFRSVYGDPSMGKILFDWTDSNSPTCMSYDSAAAHLEQ